MKRIRKHRIKTEAPEATSSSFRGQEEHDLAYYIHDRVELMRQVFAAIKPKDLKTMAPECIQHLSLDNIKELCTEELLGISSKRLCAVLDGAEPPSDTESSSRSPSPDNLETISLDSISSDEELLSQSSSRKSKKHKHRHRDAKAKSKKKKVKGSDDDAEDKSKASRAGLTVLELLELQARARAIRAQLQKEQAAKKLTETTVESNQEASSGDEVELKEEPAEVVEISSEDEKPNVEQLQISLNDSNNMDVEPQKVTKKINNLVITVPISKQTKKIKLNRNNPPVAARPVEINAAAAEATTVTVENPDKSKTVQITIATKHDTTSKVAKDTKSKKKHKNKDKIERKKEKSVKNNKKEKEGSDHDEITLQLSDSEKLDLLEDLDRKNLDKVSSSSSDPEGSSSNSEDEPEKTKDDGNISKQSLKENDVVKSDNVEDNTNIQASMKDEQEVTVHSDKDTDKTVNSDKDTNKSVDNVEDDSNKNTVRVNNASNSNSGVEPSETNIIINNSNEENDLSLQKSHKETENLTTQNEGKDVAKESNKQITETVEDENQETEVNTESVVIIQDDTTDRKDSDKAGNSKDSAETEKENVTGNDKEKNKEMSDGELSDRDSSEVEATELNQEIVCISDDDVKSKKKKKHKKKDKKSKKEKKSKKSKSDFREGCDQNFYTENSSVQNTSNNDILVDDVNNCKDEMSVVIDSNSGSEDDGKTDYIVIDNDDDIFEILSDDSSCYEVEGTVLSKEPTAEEIESLSSRIDEIKREDVITDEEIREYERRQAEKNQDESHEENIEQISWKDRYLGSKKVKRVLNVANILNALRKKNKELKKKLDESKRELEVNKEKEIREELEKLEREKQKNVEVEGSVEFYETLEGSTKYVDPVVLNKEREIDEVQPEENVVQSVAGNTELKEGQITKEMKKDAKQLLKMYKRLLKYNDMTRKKEKDPNKKIKKKKLDSVVSKVDVNSTPTSIT